MLFQSNFSTFPHGTIRYRSWLVFSFRGSCPRFFTREYKPTLFWYVIYHLVKNQSIHTGLSPSLIVFSKTFWINFFLIVFVKHNLPQPYTTQFLKFELYRFRSTLLTISRFFFLFLPLLRCFSSGGSLGWLFRVKHTRSKLLSSWVGNPVQRCTLAKHLLF